MNAALALLAAGLFGSCCARQEIQDWTSHSVTAVALSIDGRLAYTATEIGPIKVWDVLHGRRIRSIAKPPGCGDVLAFSRDVRLAISKSGDGETAVWSLATRRILSTLNPGKPLNPDKQESTAWAAAFSKDAKYVFVDTERWYEDDMGVHDVGDGSVWNLETGKKIVSHYFPLGHGARFLEKTNRVLLDGSTYDLATGNRTGALAEDPMSGYGDEAVSDDGRMAFTLSRSLANNMAGPYLGTIWSISTGKPVGRLRGSCEKLQRGEFAPNSQVLITWGDKGLIEEWNTATQRRIRDLAGLAGDVVAGSFSGRGGLFIAADEKDAAIWNVKTGRRIRTLLAPPGQKRPKTKA